MKELTIEINQNDLIYYFKSNPSINRFDDLNNGIELFETKNGEMKLCKFEE